MGPTITYTIVYGKEYTCEAPNTMPRTLSEYMHVTVGNPKSKLRESSAPYRICSSCR